MRGGPAQRSGNGIMAAIMNSCRRGAWRVGCTAAASRSCSYPSLARRLTGTCQHSGATRRKQMRSCMDVSGGPTNTIALRNQRCKCLSTLERGRHTPLFSRSRRRSWVSAGTGPLACLFGTPSLHILPPPHHHHHAPFALAALSCRLSCLASHAPTRSISRTPITII